MFSRDFAVVFSPFLSLCVCVRVSDVSVTFLSVNGSSVHNLALLPGKSSAFEPVWGFLMASDVFSAVLESIASPCMYLHVPDASEWSLGLSGSSVHDPASPAGKSGTSDPFAGVLEPFALLWVHVHMFSMPGLRSSLSDSSRCDLVLLVGMFDSFGSVRPILSISCVSSDICVFCNVMHVCAHVLHVCMACTLILVVCRPSLGFDR